MPKAKSSQSYYIEYKRQLKRIINDYSLNINSDNLFKSSTYSTFTNLSSGITRHPLRYYQLEALYILDALINTPNDKDIKRALLENVGAQSHKAPFFGFEMATGSGKTMLMGACIYMLNQLHGIDNFLIITPSSTDIYQKTIRNFERGSADTIWLDDSPFSFNLITGDNYTQNLFFDSSKDANIFIFNISKFGANAVNSEKTWESAIWQGDAGNSVSIKQYLQNKRLAIITDEAHHHQTLTAKRIISHFEPSLVLEFTATAIEATRGEDRRNQQIVYKYDIRRFLEDGYGKLVRAFAIDPLSRSTKSSVSDSEKQKIIILLLTHLLKKDALAKDAFSSVSKPLAFIKVKDETKYTRLVFNYVRNDLFNDVDNIQLLLENIKSHDFEITKLLSEFIERKYKNDIELIRKDLEALCQLSIFYYGESDKVTERKFHGIRNNEIEIIVYMQRLDEGIDLPNIYSMAVINDVSTDFKTSVKQIIGRGVRLNKEKRKYDDSTDPYLRQAEMLHIICDKGRNFEDEILAIQQEFGLNDKYLSYDTPKKAVTNRVKSEKLNDIFLPRIKADLKVKPGVKLTDLVGDIKTVTAKYIQSNCYQLPDCPEKFYLKYRPNSFFAEVDVFADTNVFHRQLLDSGGEEARFKVSNDMMKKILSIVFTKLLCLPDTPIIRTYFNEYAQQLNNLELFYFRISNVDDNLISTHFIHSFSFYYHNHIENNYFHISFRDSFHDDAYHLASVYKEHELKIPSDQIGNESRKKIDNPNFIKDLISSNYYFHGYTYSVHDYDKFDSFTEVLLADYLDRIEDQMNSSKNSFWIKNQRQISFSFGSKRYFPDFIAFKDGILYVIESKGEIFSDTKKNAVLTRLNEIPGIGKVQEYRGLLIFEDVVYSLVHTEPKIETLVKESELSLNRRQSSENLVQDPPTDLRFIEYLPVYSPQAAMNKFIKKHKTAKPTGWIKIPSQETVYDENCFVTQIKDNALSPSYHHLGWMALKFTSEQETALNKICLVYSPSIESDYEPGFTIRKIMKDSIKGDNSIFELPTYKLRPISSLYDDVIVELADSRDLCIIGYSLGINL